MRTRASRSKTCADVWPHFDDDVKPSWEIWKMEELGWILDVYQTLSYFIILHQFPITGHHFFRQDEETSPGKSWPVMKAHRGYWVMRFVIEMYRIVILKGITCDNDSNTVATSYRTNGWYCCDHTTIAILDFLFMSLGAHAGPYPPSLFILGIVAYEKTALLCCHRHMVLG